MNALQPERRASLGAEGSGGRVRTLTTVAELDSALAGRLVVSCQPVDHGPMDDDAIVVALARAAIAGGAAGLRVESAERVDRVKAALGVPVIGIVKRDLADSAVRITPWVDDVAALARAGADIIAVDATARPRPVAVAELLAAIRAHGRLAMADASCEADALAAHALGFDIIGTTLSGYTGGPVPDAPDLALIHALAGRVPRIMAEGRIHQPDDVRAARAAGAWAVTVGTAITRIELITRGFADALG